MHIFPLLLPLKPFLPCFSSPVRRDESGDADSGAEWDIEDNEGLRYSMALLELAATAMQDGADSGVEVDGQECDQEAGGDAEEVCAAVGVEQAQQELSGRHQDVTCRGGGVDECTAGTCNEPTLSLAPQAPSLLSPPCPTLETGCGDVGMPDAPPSQQQQQEQQQVEEQQAEEPDGEGHVEEAALVQPDQLQLSAPDQVQLSAPDAQEEEDMQLLSSAAQAAAEAEAPHLAERLVARATHIATLLHQAQAAEQAAAATAAAAAEEEAEAEAEARDEEGSGGLMEGGGASVSGSERSDRFDANGDVMGAEARTGEWSSGVRNVWERGEEEGGEGRSPQRSLS
jgi:hypothetical protein